MYRFGILVRPSVSIIVLVLCCAFATVSCVRYDGGANPGAYVEYQNARPVQDGQQTRVFTFPHDREYHTSSPLYDFTTRRPTFGDKSPEQEATAAPPCCGGENQQIPLDLIMQLNEVKNVSELWQFVNTDSPLGDDVDGSEYEITNRFGGDSDVERSAAIVPKPATCKPELTTVPLAPVESSSAGVFYFPSCTRVNRCGGCCSHTLLSCQPVEKEQLALQIIKSEFGGGSKLSYAGKEIVLVEQHTKCKCDCIVKPEHCNQFQEYKKSECRCMCTNTDDENKCLQENALKLWDPHSCVCRCRETLDCTSGSYFDQNTCQCAQIPSRNLDPGADRTRYKVKPIPIIPNQEDVYQV